MRYLLMTTCSRDADGITWSCDLALLGVDEPFLAGLRHRAALLRETHAQDGRVHEIAFWADSQLAFYTDSVMDRICLSEAEEAYLDGDSFVFLDRGPGRLPGAEVLREQSVELTRLIVRLNAVASGPPLITVLWSTVPKQTDASVLTVQVPLELFGA